MSALMNIKKRKKQNETSTAAVVKQSLSRDRRHPRIACEILCYAYRITVQEKHRKPNRKRLKLDFPDDGLSL